jgi:hypothetical protein
MNTPLGGGAGALQAEVAGSAPASALAPLTPSVLEPLRAAAIDRWRLAGATAADLALLQAAEVRIVELPGAQLGWTEPGRIWIDATAAGHGWFVDSTPGDDLEFPAGPTSPAYGKMDLLTVLTHEMGHLLGLEHTEEEGPLADRLATGVRWTPESITFVEGSTTTSSQGGTATSSSSSTGGVLPEAKPARRRVRERTAGAQGGATALPALGIQPSATSAPSGQPGTNAPGGSCSCSLCCLGSRVEFQPGVANASGAGWSLAVVKGSWQATPLRPVDVVLAELAPAVLPDRPNNS